MIRFNLREAQIDAGITEAGYNKYEGCQNLELIPSTKIKYKPQKQCTVCKKDAKQKVDISAKNAPTTLAYVLLHVSKVFINWYSDEKVFCKYATNLRENTLEKLQLPAQSLKVNN